MKKFLNLFLLLIVLINIFACKNNVSISATSSSLIDNNKVQIKIEKDNVVSVTTYDTIDYEKVKDIPDSLFSRNLSSSAAWTVSDNFETYASYSLDAKSSNKPVYVVKTDIANDDNNYYKTIGLVYNENIGDNYNDEKRNGIDKEIYDILPFMCNYIINEKGFFIEVNLKSSQMIKYDINRSKGTNQNGEYTFNLYEAARYLCDNSSSIEDALSLIKYLNIRDLGEHKNYVGGSLYMADSMGNYGSLELINNELIWNDMKNADANFYVNDKYPKAIVGSGVGRVEALQKGIKDVKTENDMLSLMRSVRYSQVYMGDKSKFDVSSECSGNIGIDLINNYNDLIITNDYKYIEEHIDDDGMHYIPYTVLNKEGFKERLNEIYKEIEKIEKVKNENMQSIFQVVFNCSTKKMFVEFFENEKINLSLSF